MRTAIIIATTSATWESGRPLSFSHSGRNGSWMPLPRNSTALNSESLRLKLRDDMAWGVDRRKSAYAASKPKIHHSP